MLLVVQYAEISRDDFVLENSTGRYVDALAVVGYDDDGTLQPHHQRHYHHQFIIAIINSNVQLLAQQIATFG